MTMLEIKSNKRAVVDRDSKLIVVSFRWMRLIVGVLGLSIGILLPLITELVTRCPILQESISHYYYTIAGDVFVGLLCAVGFFLIMYPGGGKWEDLWTNFAGVLALCIAFFPTHYQQLVNTCTYERVVNYPCWVPVVHLSCAAGFFLILGGVAIFQFPRVAINNEDPIKRRNRNRFYRICGAVMWACILFLSPMVLKNQFGKSYSQFLSEHKLVYWIEVLALIAFGVCWLVKGFVLSSIAGQPKARKQLIVEVEQ